MVVGFHSISQANLMNELLSIDSSLPLVDDKNLVNTILDSNQKV